MKNFGYNNKPPLELHIKLTIYSILRVPNIIESVIKCFEVSLKIVFKNRKLFNSINTTKLQENVFKYFQVH